MQPCSYRKGCIIQPTGRNWLYSSNSSPGEGVGQFQLHGNERISVFSGVSPSYWRPKAALSCTLSPLFERPLTFRRLLSNPLIESWAMNVILHWFCFISTIFPKCLPVKYWKVNRFLNLLPFLIIHWSINMRIRLILYRDIRFPTYRHMTFIRPYGSTFFRKSSFHTKSDLVEG